MRGVFGSIVGKLTGVTTLAGALHNHFAHLDNTQSGLSRQIIDYVLDGSGGSVLSTLGMPAIASGWRQGIIYDPRRKPIELMLAAGNAHEALRRFGEVMAVLEPVPPNSYWGLFGTGLTPDWLRHALSAHNAQKTYVCDITQVEKLAELGGTSSSLAILDILFHPGPGVPYGTQYSVDVFGGCDAWLADHVTDVTTHHAKLDAIGRSGLAQTIGRFDLVERYLPLLVDYGLADAKSVRGAATRALTAASPETLKAELNGRYSDANPTTRAKLVELASATLSADVGPLLEQWRETETERRPLEAIDRALANVTLNNEAKPAAEPGEGGYGALDGSTVTSPPLVPLPPPSRIPDDVYDLLRPSIDSFNERLRIGQQEAKKEQWHWSRGHAPITEGDLREFKKTLEGTGPVKIRRSHQMGMGQLQWWNVLQQKWDRTGIIAFYAHPALTVRHLVTVLRHDMGEVGHFLNVIGDGLENPAARALRQRLNDGADIRTVVDLWVGLGGRQPLVQYLEQQWQPSVADIEPKLLWPLVAESFEIIDEALGLRPQSGETPLQMANALDLLGVLPKIPQRYFLPLMALATGSQRTFRQRARDMLAGAPKINEAIERLLNERQQDTRAGAAEWLAARNARTSILALRKALKGEKSDVARAAIITALERLGDDVSDCFDQDLLLAEAEKGLDKASLKGLEWFPSDLLPRLTWRDGKEVAPRIVRWWIVLANRLKQPGGNALLDLWLDRLKAEDAQQLGLFVLKSWIDHDTRRPTDDEANAHALAHVDAQLQQNRQWAKQHPLYAEYYITDYDKLFASLKRDKLSQYFGSAADCKGILALAGLAEGSDAASAVRAYFKDHGARVSQDKALLDMLAANPSPAAIQVVLATANRFKARSVQEHASALIENIAQRRGWTSDELADRTIPTAGLDERGETEIDCGADRSFRLVLDDRDALQLFNPAGQPVKALPAPRNDAEKPLLAAAKKLLATARKELKQTHAAQIERLYEAMCLERRWKAEDWNRHLLEHPIVGRLVRRLVWIGRAGDGTQIALFRPLNDGSLSDAKDDAVVLDEIADVQLAHSSLLTPEEVEVWRTHLADYEVDPLFAQFDLDLPKLPEAARAATEIEDRKGWMIETFKLRGAATKLGFLRGSAEDGGVFMTYERRYSSAGLVAVIDFTGSPLPEQNISAAFHGMRFVKLQRGNAWHGGGLALKDVPPVLLAESWKAFHRIAAAGTGFDPDWEKKSVW